jgi:hypothetical protein
MTHRTGHSSIVGAGTDYVTGRQRCVAARYILGSESDVGRIKVLYRLLNSYRQGLGCFILKDEGTINRGSNPGGCKKSVFLIESRLALGSTHAPTQWTPALNHQRPGREVDHSTTTPLEKLRMSGAIASLPRMPSRRAQGHLYLYFYYPSKDRPLVPYSQQVSRVFIFT